MHHAFLSRCRQCAAALLFITTLTATLPAHAEPHAEGVTAAAQPAVSASQPAELPVAPPDRITLTYVTDYVADTGTMLSSPLRWDGHDWLAAGLVLGTTAGLVFADEGIRDFAQRNQNSSGRTIASVGNALGNPLYTLPPLGLFYLYGHVYDNAKARRTSLLAVESLAISGAFTWTAKMAAQRPRPFTGESATTWDGPGFKNSNPSFPSGHTQSAFAIASVIAEEYGTQPYVPPIAYGLASLTGLSRIYDNKHWASDVFFGAAIGYVVGKAVVRYHTPATVQKVQLLPSISQESIGLSAYYRF